MKRRFVAHNTLLGTHCNPIFLWSICATCMFINFDPLRLHVNCPIEFNQLFILTQMIKSDLVFTIRLVQHLASSSVRIFEGVMSKHRPTISHPATAAEQVRCKRASQRPRLSQTGLHNLVQQVFRARLSLNHPWRLFDLICG